MPAILLQQMVVADWRQPFVLFNPSCAKDRHAESQDSCFVVFCTMGITFLALGGTVTAEEK